MALSIRAFNSAAALAFAALASFSAFSFAIALRAIDIYYKRTGIYSDSGTTNNIAKMHVNILELNAAKRRAGLPEIEE
jgi:hypothetical protein